MLITSQLRAARALIGISPEELALSAGLSAEQVQQLEASAGDPDPELAERLRRVFEAKGVIFLAAGQQDSSGPGVRLHQHHGDEGIRPQNLNSSNDG